MGKSRTTAFLLVLIFLVVAAVTFIFLTSLDNGSDDKFSSDNVVIVAPSVEPSPAAAENTPIAAPTTPPSSAPAEVTLSPAASPAAAPTPAPAAEQTPSAEPSPVPTTAPTSSPAESYGTPLGSGSFTSDTGAKINIIADWVAMTSGPDTVNVKVTVSVISYSLVTAAFPDRVHIGLNGQYVSLGAPAINYTGTAQVTSPLNDYTFTANLADGDTVSLPLSVVWDYRGSYGEMQIDSIECGGSITLSR